MNVTATQGIATLPEGWEIVKLGDHFDILTGYPFKSELFSNNPPGTKIVRGDNVTSGHLRWGDKTRYWKNITRDLEKYLLKNDDIIISMDGSLVGKNFAKINESELPLLLVQRVARLRLKNGLSLDFAFQYIKSEFPKYVAKVRTISAIPHISPNDINDFTVPLPPLPEQRRIATILTTVDDAIQRSRQAAAETERLKVGVMQELMTKGIGHTEFKESADVGTVPKEWKILKLEDFCISSAYGPRFSGSFYDSLGNVAVLRTTDLDQEGNISYEQMPRATLDLNEFKDHFLQSNDLVITRSGTCGIGAVFSIYKIPVLPGAFLIRFRLSPEIEPQFLKQYINSSFGRKRITKLECGGVQKNLKGSALLKIKIPCPSPIEQKHIISVLSTIDRKLSLQRQRTAYYEHLKQGLMSEMLTGKRRVKVT